MADTVYRMTDSELEEFVKAFVRGQVFSSAHIPAAEHRVLPMVFLPLALGALQDHPSPDDIGLVWEFLSASGARSVNGHPMFTSARIMHKDDWERARDAIVRAKMSQPHLCIRMLNNGFKTHIAVLQASNELFTHISGLASVARKVKAEEPSLVSLSFALPGVELIPEVYFLTEERQRLIDNTMWFVHPTHPFVDDIPEHNEFAPRYRVEVTPTKATQHDLFGVRWHVETAHHRSLTTPWVEGPAWDVLAKEALGKPYVTSRRLGHNMFGF